MGRRIVVMGALLVALFGAPRPSHAGLLEIIWEMSGPQMIGISYAACMASSRSLEQCRIGQFISRDLVTRRKRAVSGAWRRHLRIDGKGFGHAELRLGRSVDGSDRRGHRLSLVHVPRRRGSGRDEVQVHHGIGVTYNRLFGRDFRPFDKFGITITPIDIAVKRVAVGIKLRMYPNGFTDDEFKPVPVVSQNRPFETTVGFTVSLILDRK